MPQFKSTYNILKEVDADEVFDTNWMDSDKLVLPPKVDWDYKRELQVEDVDIWECLYTRGGGVGVYAAWLPYAEFYMITTGSDLKSDDMWINGIAYQHRNIETFYGPEAQKRTFQRASQLGIHLPIYKEWVDNNDMWLHQPSQDKKIILDLGK